MKKGIPIVIVVLLLLCVLVVLGGGAGWYFLLRQTPQKAFTEAFDYFENGDYYQLSFEADITAELEGEKITLSGSGEGKRDIQNDKSYRKSTNRYDGYSTTEERYIIGDDEYTSTNGGEFIKTARDDDATVDDSMLDAAKKEDYEILDEETIDGVACYHYKVMFEENHVEPLAELFAGGLAEGTTVSDLSFDDAYMEVWVSKNDSRLVRVMVKMGSMEFKVTLEGQSYNTILTYNQTMNYTNWGEMVEIEEPI